MAKTTTISTALFFELTDQYGDYAPKKPGKLAGKVVFKEGQLWIFIEGFGEMEAKDGQGTPICVELVNGKLKVNVWNDINRSDPDVIDMTEAQEVLRKEKW